MDLQSDVCADCTALSPQWASVNRGVLLCDECSSIHRQLGRHISQVKHLKKSRWRSSQLDMVRYLAAACANRYWEHVLYEPMLAGQHSNRTGSETKRSTTRKPKPTDPMHPTKADFIREKYLFLGFFKKPRSVNLEDLNQQLHASVRTGVLETSLYLLALGANPNFIHPVKGTAPMHVACQYGQLGQVEVLLAYGADVCVRDVNGQTPVDVALDKALAAAEAMGTIPSVPLTHEQKLRYAWNPLVDTLVNAYYEVTDSLAYFLSRHVPDHKAAVLGPPNAPSPIMPRKKIVKSPVEDSAIDSSVRNSKPENGISSTRNGHFLISTPLLQSIGDNNGDIVTVDSWVNEARRRLNQLSNMAFEDLCVDVYDEADRRLTNSLLENVDSGTERKANGISNPPTGPVHTTAQKQTPMANRSLALYFLPPNTAYSSVRNQARQKLGRLSTVEFHTLVLDILTEVSARLLPLFPPVQSPVDITVTTRPTRSETSHHHPYSAYLVSSHSGLEDGILPRMAPLPAPPVPNRSSDPETASAGSPSDVVGSSRPINNLLGYTNGSSSGVVGDRNRDSKPISESQSPMDKPESPAGFRVKRGVTNRVKGTRDDPVYDQVAADSDLLSSVSTPNSAARRSPASSINSTPSGSPNTNDKQLAETDRVSAEDITNSVETSKDDVTEHRLSSSPPNRNSPETKSASPSQSEVLLNVASRPGPVPGSRRLHLSHTGRIAHRASVPASHAPSSSSADPNLTPILEAGDLAIEPGTVLSSRANVASCLGAILPLESGSAMLSGSPKTFMEPCCVAARNEVERLRKENVELRARMAELQSAKEIVDNRLKDLEERMQAIDKVVHSLKEEKSALLAAFSAGMVMTHSPPKVHRAVVSPIPTTTDTTSETPTVSVSLTPKDIARETKALYDDEEDEEYEDEHSMKRTTESGDYAVGSHCLDSGMMLRQGIISRAGSGRIDSPASSAPSRNQVMTSTAPVSSASPTGRAQESETTKIVTKFAPSKLATTGVNQSSAYVNVASMPPRPLPKPTGIVLNPIVTSAPLEGTDDYTTPNTTGSPSPAPIPNSTSATTITNPSHTTSSSISPPSCTVVVPGARLIQQQRQHELQKQHDQILASIATLPDYDPPADSGRSPSVVKASTPPGTSILAGWQAPSSDRVVRCVEAIIVHIRSLVQLANADRLEDCVNCSVLIQSAVHDIVALFPPLNQCPSRVASALSDLSVVSQSLRPHCEQMSGKLGRSASGNLGHKALASEVNVLIRHAHQIAKSAKELLSLFQRTQR
ncbi:unnamed protein product [Calicophoron daubneyi]|uniref:Arf-GAP domain-containing protein n=1 Tax=Calicophoron daubneyi TaxID=300641 RepID=A0AAV2TFZ5_CALDB